MHNPYRDRKSRKLLNGCLVVVVSFVFIGMHMFMTTWVPPYHTSERSLLGADSTIVGIGTDYTKQGESKKRKGDDNDDGILHVVTTRFMQDQPKLYAIGKARLRLANKYNFIITQAYRHRHIIIYNMVSRRSYPILQF